MQRNLYTEQLSQTAAFTHRYPLHTKAFTLAKFYREELLHANTHRSFYTGKFLHKEVFTQSLQTTWLGACRRPRHETVFLLVHCTGATARAHFFPFLLCFASVKPLFLSFFVVFFGVVLVGGWEVGGGGGGVITFFGLEHIWDVMS